MESLPESTTLIYSHAHLSNTTTPTDKQSLNDELTDNEETPTTPPLGSNRARDSATSTGAAPIFNHAHLQSDPAHFSFSEPVSHSSHAVNSAPDSAHAQPSTTYAVPSKPSTSAGAPPAGRAVPAHNRLPAAVIQEAVAVAKAGRIGAGGRGHRRASGGGGAGRPPIPAEYLQKTVNGGLLNGAHGVNGG